MSKNLERVIQRAISDAAFRRQLQSNPEAALRGFKLTDTEVAALRSGDAGKLTSLGIDQRMSKTFTFGGEGLASRASIGGDLTSGSGMSNADRDPRMNAAVEGGDTSGATRNVIPTDASGSTPAFDPGVVSNRASVGDPRFDGSASSVIADPANPAHARGYIGDQAAPTSDALEDQSHSFAASRSADVAGASTASVIGDPDNPANARGYIGEQAASTSDAIEDQSHAFAATRSADVSSSGLAAPIEGSPEEFAFRNQGASTVSASNIGDPDNPASARGYIGEQAASTSDAIEDQSHAFAATRDQGASTVSASNIGDPDNPASARGYIGEQAMAPTSDAIEDQSHVIASRADAFLTEGEVSQYTADPNLSSDQAEDAGHLFNPNASDAIPDDGGTASVHHEPDVPS